MSFSDILSLIQTISVVGGLIAVVLQLRSATRTFQATTYSSILQQTLEFHQKLMENPSFAASSLKLILKPLAPQEGVKSPPTHADDLNSSELVLALSFINFAENAFYQYKRGHIPEELWAGWQLQLPLYLRHPTVKMLWEANKHSYWDEFVLFMEREAR